MKGKSNEKQSASPLQLMDKRIRKTREMNKNRKMEIMSWFPLCEHLLYCPLRQLQPSATLTKHSQAYFQTAQGCKPKSSPMSDCLICSTASPQERCMRSFRHAT